jgi:hypothetical protein
MMDASGWSLGGLAAEHGTQTIYRVTRDSGSVRLEGRHGSQTCLLRIESPAAAARHLLAAAPAASSMWNSGYLALAGPSDAPAKGETCEMVM